MRAQLDEFGFAQHGFQAWKYLVLFEPYMVMQQLAEGGQLCQGAPSAVEASTLQTQPVTGLEVEICCAGTTAVPPGAEKFSVAGAREKEGAVAKTLRIQI